MTINKAPLTSKQITSVIEAVYSFVCEKMCADNVLYILAECGVTTDLESNWRDNVLTVFVCSESYKVEV